VATPSLHPSLAHSADGFRNSPVEAVLLLSYAGSTLRRPAGALFFKAAGELAEILLLKGPDFWTTDKLRRYADGGRDLPEQCHLRRIRARHRFCDDDPGNFR
jgi:hypothetical protein